MRQQRQQRQPHRLEDEHQGEDVATVDAVAEADVDLADATEETEATAALVIVSKETRMG